MANFLMDEFPAVVKQKDWVAPSVEVNNTDTEQLGNFLAQKIAASQPVKVEANPEYMQATPQVAMPVSGAEPAIAQTPIVPVEPTKNTLVAAQQQQQQPVPVTPAETLAPSEHSKYWGNKVFGKIPLDQFVQMAGMLANSFNPEDPLGKQLATMGGEAYKERIKQEYEGPNKLLEQKLKQEQLKSKISGNLTQTRMSEFIQSWPERENTLRASGMSQKDLDREFSKGVTNIMTEGFPTRGAALVEKSISGKEALLMKDLDREAKIDEAIRRGERFQRTQEERERHNRVMEEIGKIRTEMRDKAEKEDKTLVQVEDENGNMIWKKRSEIVPGEVAKPRYTLPQLTKFKTILRNPKAVSAKVEDITAAAEAVNTHGNEPSVFLPETLEKQFVGTNQKVPFTKDTINVKEVRLPKNKQGQQIYSSDVRKLASKRGITFEEAAKEVIKFYGAK